jgi:hypothetical protein
MKIIRKANKDIIRISKREWIKIGAAANWFSGYNKSEEISEYMGIPGIDPDMGDYNEEDLMREFNESVEKGEIGAPRYGSSVMTIDGVGEIDAKSVEETIDFFGRDRVETDIDDNGSPVYRVKAGEFMSAAEQAGIDLGDVENKILDSVPLNGILTIRDNVINPNPNNPSLN